MPYVFNYEVPSTTVASSYVKAGKGARAMYDEQQNYERQSAAAAAAEAQRQFDAKMRMQAAEIQAQQAQTQGQYQKEALRAQTTLQKQAMLNEGYLQTQELRGIQSQKFPEAASQVLQGLRDGSLAYSPEQERRYSQLTSSLNRINTAPNWKPAQRAQARNMIFQEMQTLLNNPTRQMQKKDISLEERVAKGTVSKDGLTWYEDKDGAIHPTSSAKPTSDEAKEREAKIKAADIGLKAGALGEGGGFNKEAAQAAYDFIMGKSAPAGTPNPPWGTGSPQQPIQPQQSMIPGAPNMNAMAAPEQGMPPQMAPQMPPQMGESPTANPMYAETPYASPPPGDEQSVPMDMATGDDIQQMVADGELPQEFLQYADLETGIITDPTTGQQYRILKDGKVIPIESASGGW